MLNFKKGGIFFGLIFVAVLALSGCNNSGENKTYVETDIFGNEISFSDTSDDMFLYETGDYVYVIDSRGETYTSYDSPEIFEAELFDLKMGESSDYYKAESGKGFKDLTLKNAQTTYEYNSSANMMNIIKSYASFEGSLSLKGYIAVAAEEGGKILFSPMSGEWNGMPMIWGATKTFWSSGDFEILSDAPIIRLGEKKKYDIDLSAISDDGSISEVEIVLSNLELRSSEADYGSAFNTAEIVSVKPFSGSSEIAGKAENNVPIKDEAFYEKIKLNVGLSNDEPLLNLKSPVPSKVCYVGETDTLFYSDKNGLFQKNGDETIILSDQEAMAITLYKGGLYYIVPKDDGSHFPSGTVYCLDLETGEERSVIAQDDISNLFISDDTIYFIKQSVEELESGAFKVGMRRMKCGIDGKDPVIDEEYTAAADEKYIVSRGGDTVSVCDKKTSELLASGGDSLSSDQICIYKDKVYYIQNDFDHPTRNSMCVIDCKNGSSEESTVRTLDGGYGYLDDYSFIGDELYMLGGMFYKKTEDKTISYEADASYASVYNGGDSLYGLKRNGTIARLIFNDDNGNCTVKGEELKYEKNE